MLENLPADSGPETVAFEQELRRALFQRAAEQVRGEVAPATWQGIRVDGERREFTGPPRPHPAVLECLVFSPDSRTLATGAADQQFRLFPVTADQAAPPVRTTAPHQRDVDLCPPAFHAGRPPPGDASRTPPISRLVLAAPLGPCADRANRTDPRWRPQGRHSTPAQWANQRSRSRSNRSIRLRRGNRVWLDSSPRSNAQSANNSSVASGPRGEREDASARRADAGGTRRGLGR